jgi:hypothetical protein
MGALGFGTQTPTAGFKNISAPGLTLLDLCWRQGHDRNRP